MKTKSLLRIIVVVIVVIAGVLVGLYFILSEAGIAPGLINGLVITEEDGLILEEGELILTEEADDAFVLTNASKLVEDFPTLLFDNGYNTCKYYYNDSAIARAGLETYEEYIADAFLRECEHYSVDEFIGNSSLLSVVVGNASPTELTDWLPCEDLTPRVRIFDNSWKVVYCNDSVSKSYAFLNNSIYGFTYTDYTELTYYFMLEFLGI